MTNEVDSYPLKHKLQFWLTQDRGVFVTTALGDVIDSVNLFYRTYDTLLSITPFEKIQKGGYSLLLENLKPNEEYFQDNHLPLYRYICNFPYQPDSVLNLFLLIVSGKFDELYGIYTQKNAGRNMKFEIWSSSEIDEQSIIDFFMGTIPNMKIRKK